MASVGEKRTLSDNEGDAGRSKRRRLTREDEEGGQVYVDIIEGERELSVGGGDTNEDVFHQELQAEVETSESPATTQLCNALIGVIDRNRLFRLVKDGADSSNGEGEGEGQPSLTVEDKRLAIAQQTERDADVARRLLADIRWDAATCRWLAQAVGALDSASYAVFADLIKFLRKKLPVLGCRLGELDTSLLFEDLGIPVSISLKHLGRPVPQPRRSNVKRTNKAHRFPPGCLFVSDSRSHPASAKKWSETLSVFGPVVLLDPSGALDSKMGLSVPIVAQSIREVKRIFSGSVVLFGKGLGAYSLCAASVDESVDAIVSFGYPLKQEDGTNGGDVLEHMKVPILLIQGSQSSECPIEELESIRKRMQVANFLEVIDGASWDLDAMQSDEGTTERFKTRVLEAVHEFLEAVLK